MKNQVSPIAFLVDFIGGIDGALAFTQSDLWKEMNVGLALDEGLANPEDKYTVCIGQWLGLNPHRCFMERDVYGG